MGRTASTKPQCLYKGAIYFLPFTLHLRHDAVNSYRQSAHMDVTCSLLVFCHFTFLLNRHQG